MNVLPFALSPDSRESGFTLVELAVALGVFLILIGSVLVLAEAGFRSERGQQARTQSLDDVRAAMNRMSKEVRQALSISSSSTASRLDMQTLINGVQYEVIYDVSGTTLRRRVGAGQAVTLAKGLTSSMVFCYDPPACALTAPATATPSIIRLSLSLQPGQSAAAPVTLSVDVHLRNAASS